MHLSIFQKENTATCNKYCPVSMSSPAYKENVVVWFFVVGGCQKLRKLSGGIEEDLKKKYI